MTGALSYEIVFANDSAFTSNVNSKTTTGSPYTVTSSFSDGKYFWRVRAYNVSNLPGPWSVFRILTIDSTAPPVPVLSSPASNAFTHRTPIFKWQNSSTAVIYEFQYDTNANFLSPKYASSRQTNYCSPSAMKVGTYYWRVRAQDAVGNWSAWSTSFTVTIIGP